MKKQIIVDRGPDEIKTIQCNRQIAGVYFDEGRSYEFSSRNFDEQTVEMCDFLRHRHDQLDVYVNLPPEKTLIREFEIPFTDKKKIKELAPHEIEALLPYEMDEIVHEYRVFPDYKNQKSKIISVSAPKDFVADYTRAMADQNILLRGIYVPMEGLYYLSNIVGEENAVYFFVSARTSRLLVVEEGKWKSSRLFPMGYEVLIRRLASAWKKTEEESKNLLLTMPGDVNSEEDSDYFRKNYKMSKPQVAGIFKTIQNYGSDLVKEIHRTVNLSNEERSYKLYLATDMGNQIFLENLIAQNLGTPVETFPYERTPAYAAGREYFLASSSALAINASEAMNLYTRELKKAALPEKAGLPLAPIVTAAVGVVFLIVSFVLDFVDQKKSADVQRARQKNVYQALFLEKPNDDVSIVSQAKKKIAEERSKSEIYRKFLNKPKLIVALKALEESISSIQDIEVQRLVYEKEELKLYGETNSYESLGEIQKSIQENKTFSKVDKQKEYTAPGKKGTSNRVRFIIVMKPVLEK